MPGFVDVHSHVVPSGDDGAKSVEDGLTLCRLAVESGTEILFATPHAHAAWDTYPRTPERLAQFDAAYAEMRPEVAAWGLDLRRGWEVFPSEVGASVPPDFLLEGTTAVLIEFPGFWLQIDDAIGVVEAAALLVEEADLVPVLAHPERCRAVAADPGAVRPFVERGWLLCLNAPSLVGGHGEIAMRTAWALLNDGLIALVASDGHSPLRPPVLSDGYQAVREQLGHERAHALFDGSVLPWS